MVGTYDFTVMKGDTWEKTLTFRENGETMDLTTYSALFQVRASQAATSTILSLTDASGITLTSDGSFTILVANTVTSAISEDVGVYNLQMTDADGKVKTYMSGKVYFIDDVTR